MLVSKAAPCKRVIWPASLSLSKRGRKANFPSGISSVRVFGVLQWKSCKRGVTQGQKGLRVYCCHLWVNLSFYGCLSCWHTLSFLSYPSVCIYISVSESVCCLHQKPVRNVPRVSYALTPTQSSLNLYSASVCSTAFQLPPLNRAENTWPPGNCWLASVALLVLASFSPGRLPASW